MSNDIICHPTIYDTKLSWHIMPDANEYITVLQEQGVSNFDPIAFYKESNKESILIEQEANMTKKQIKKQKISKAGKKIIEDNIKRKEKELKIDEESRLIKFMENITDLDDLSLRIKAMRTNYGRIKLKAKLLENFLINSYNLAAHIVFYSLQNEIIEDNELKIFCNVIISKYKLKYENEDMLSVQMKQMSSYLPPLDPLFTGVMKLDNWQLDIFKMIEEKKNILVCAPTSAGKTVCSSYCAVIGNKTIFVVPSDELARQVAGIFRNLSGISVKVVTNKEYFSDGDYKVLVGTPNKLEEYLILNGHSEFTYAIFDEWHMLNSEEGGSYEKLFKLLKCPFLALSATLESPNSIKSWMEEIKNEDVHLVEYKKRFIVQQRYLWNDNTLTNLHPLSCVDLNFLKSSDFLTCNLSFTPRDSFDLYDKIIAVQAYQKDLNLTGTKLPIKNISEDDKLHPKNILNKDKWDQITLTETIEIERTLKEYIVNLANSNSELAEDILKEYEVKEIECEFDLVKLIKILLKKNMCPAIFFKICPIRCLQIFKMIVTKLEEQQNTKYPHHNEDLNFRQNYYKKYMEDVETTRNKTKLPKDSDPDTFFKEQQERIEYTLLDEMKRKYESIIQKRIQKINDDNNISDKVKNYYNKYYSKDLENVEKQNKLYYIDKDRQHPEFCFNNMGIDSYEMRKIRRELKKTLNQQISWDHPFLIGIERGIIPYFKDMEVPYQRIAQSLFSQKKIPIVISDESLGYGINLPIRTVVMLGETKPETIDPVIANQMSGRSGRRGIDREGNIIYVGVNWKKILRGQYTPLVGKNPINEYLPLPFYFNKMDKDDIYRVFKKSLYNYANNNNYNEKKSMKIILNKLKEKNNNYCRKKDNSLLIWSCRNFGSNSFYLPKAINSILTANHYQLFEIFTTMFDINEDKLDDSHEIYNIFSENDKPQLCCGNYLLSVYKKQKLNNIDDIKRLKNIANLVSILHINLLSKDKNFVNTLEIIFNNLKNIIRKHLF